MTKTESAANGTLIHGSTFISQQSNWLRVREKQGRVRHHIHFKYNDGDTNAMPRAVTWKRSTCWLRVQRMQR